MLQLNWTRSFNFWRLDKSSISSEVFFIFDFENFWFLWLLRNFWNLIQLFTAYNFLSKLFNQILSFHTYAEGYTLCILAYTFLHPPFHIMIPSSCHTLVLKCDLHPPFVHSITSRPSVVCSFLVLHFLPAWFRSVHFFFCSRAIGTTLIQSFCRRNGRFWVEPEIVVFS